LIDKANDFVTGNYWQLWVRQFAVDDVEVGPANSTASHPDPYFPRGWFWIRKFRKGKWLSELS